MNNAGKFISESSNSGKLVILIGLLVAIPVIVVPFFPGEEKYIFSFLIPSVISFLSGIIICIATPRMVEPVTFWQSSLQKGSLPVMFAWFFAFLLGAVPFIIGRKLGIIHAFFESVSGWTTTGLTVVDVTDMPHIFLFHRAFMQYCGGLGFIIMISMFVQGSQNMNLFNAEGHPDRLMPSLKKTSQTIFIIYSFFLILGILGFYLFGMSLFDALCHTMSALSTAGFTTKTGSIGHYRSLPIQVITIILMLIGSTNFAVLLILSRGKFRRAFRVSEVRFMIGLLIVFVPLAAFSLVKNMGLSFGESLINSLFGIVTTFTTTGYSIMDYAHWPPFAHGLLFLLMFIGGSAGSTAGGIKLIRAYLLIRIAIENIKNRLSPVQRITKPAYYRIQSREFIDNNLIKDTVGFIACYVAVFFIGTLLLTLTADCTLYDAMFEFTSAFGTVGISNGLTSANASVGSLVILMIGMILGRLEVFIVFIAIYSGIQTMKNKITNRNSLSI